MLTLWLRLTTLSLVFAAPALATPEDEALQAFNSLYGEEMKRSLATPDTADDVALAAKLLEAAKSITGQPALLAVLCEKAAELGKPTAGGRATAIQAMELEAEKVPERRTACIEKIAALRQMEYDASRPEGKAPAGEALIAALLALADAKMQAGDAAAASDACRRALAVAATVKSESRAAIQAKLESLAALQKAAQKVAALKARLQGAPTDAATRTDLIKTLVTELDDPAAAAKFVDTTVDAALQKFVPGAAKGLEQTPELACKELGDWYRGLADQAAGPAKTALVTRARAYYGRFLSLHATEDVARAQVTLAAKKLDEAPAPAETAKADTPAPKTTGPTRTGAPAKAGAAAPAAATSDTLAANQWHDVLKYVDTNKDPVFGTMPVGWRRDGKTIVCSNSGYSSSSESKITVPVMPQGSYDLQVKFALNHSHGSAGVYLPLGTTSVMLRVCGAGTSGLEYINGNSAYSNGTGTPTTLGLNLIHTIDVRVTVTGDRASILATLNGKPLVNWSGPQTDLSPYSTVDRRCLGLHAYYTTVTYGLLRMRPAQEARLYKSDGNKPELARPPGSTSARPSSETSGRP